MSTPSGRDHQDAGGCVQSAWPPGTIGYNPEVDSAGPRAINILRRHGVRALGFAVLARTVSARWRPYATTAFIVAWLSLQIVVPLVQKFELPTFRYRWARFSWAMFSRLVPRYEVSLFRTQGTGDPEPIPDIGRYVSGYRSPDPMPRIASYVSEDEVHDRFSRLVTYLARERRDGYTYVASIRWTAYQAAGVPGRVEFRAEAIE